MQSDVNKHNKFTWKRIEEKWKHFSIIHDFNNILLLNIIDNREKNYYHGVQMPILAKELTQKELKSELDIKE
jgi:hypothetical protein